jgi:hypothetical protein
VSVRGRRYTTAVGALVRAALRKKWFGESSADSGIRKAS